ncbi:MAG: DUF4147 domain-containing protein [Rhodoferax sp.]|nr:DUF4147 domain-containing protein [Rhodoferax sp.]MCM2297053.1 DUF4147 domain-containing protein [Rhodoferax sp.]
MEGSHPVPDQTSVGDATALIQAVSGLTQDDLVIALASGGVGVSGAGRDTADFRYIR